MPILLAVAGLLLLALLFGPQLWIRHVLKRHGAERADLPGTGAELARHLLDEAGLAAVKVELTGDGDHYDPEAQAVRLLPQHYDGRSIAAVAVAAHEVSHAVQHAHGEPAFARRLASGAQARLGRARGEHHPVPDARRLHPGALACAGRARTAGRRAAALDPRRGACRHLPVELDASFGKALPVLLRGRYLGAADLPAARSVLRAAAFTYLAAALATLVSLGRWLRILRF